jgi:hypothetical protein
MTIINRSEDNVNSALSIALAVLGWILSDDDRAQRLLSLTGLTPDQLRSGIEDPVTMGAVLDFLCAHEPDLLAAADMIGIEPSEIATARTCLSP